MRAALTVIPRILLYWPMMSPVLAVWHEGLELSNSTIFNFISLHMKQRGVIELLYVEETAPTDIHQGLLNVSGNQTAAVSTMWQNAVCFNSGDNRASPLMQIF